MRWSTYSLCSDWRPAGGPTPPCACGDMSTPTQPSSAHPARSPAMQPATYCQPSASLSRSASNSASQ